MKQHNAAGFTPAPHPFQPVIDWTQQAGQIALTYFNNLDSFAFKSNNSFVTQADLEIEDFLLEQFRTTYPNDGLIAEEGARRDNSTGRIWAIDPLDGTTVFVQGLPGWGISIGLLEAGQPTFGVFLMPLLNDLTYTVGEQVFCNGQKLDDPVQSTWEHKSYLAVSASAHDDFDIDLRLTRTVGGVGASLIYVAKGSATAALMPKARFWDIVGGAAILHRAGGELRYLSGQPIDYLELLDGELALEPIIAGHPDVLDQIQQAIRPLPKYFRQRKTG